MIDQFDFIFTSKLRYEVKNESESKMHLVRSFGVKWHKSNMIVKPFIKSDLNKQLHLSGQILKTSLLSHITAGSSWLIIHDSSISWLLVGDSTISIQGFVENDPSSVHETLISLLSIDVCTRLLLAFASKAKMFCYFMH